MKVVIVGGGFAGIKSALELKNTEGVEVVLISKNEDFEYHGISNLSPADVVFNIVDLFASAPNVTVVKDTVTALNARVKAVKGESGQIYRYDSLLLCLGREKGSHSVPGAGKYAYGINSMRDVRVFYNSLLDSLKATHHPGIRVIVVGAGPSGVEIAGAMQDYASMVATRYGIKKKHIEVELFESSDRVLPHLIESASRKAHKRLEKLGVKVQLNSKVVSCSQNTIQLASGSERAADMIVWAAGSEPLAFFGKYPEVFEVKNGHVVVDEHMRVPKAEDIFLLGDCAEALYRGMAQTSLQDAEHAVKFLTYSVGKAPAHYVPKEPVYVIPIGEKWALVQKNGRVVSGKYGWLKRRSTSRILDKHFEHLKKQKSAGK